MSFPSLNTLNQYWNLLSCQPLGSRSPETKLFQPSANRLSCWKDRRKRCWHEEVRKGARAIATHPGSLQIASYKVSSWVLSTFMTVSMRHIWLYQGKYCAFHGLADRCTYSEDLETMSWPPPWEWSQIPVSIEGDESRVVWGLCACVLFCFFKPVSTVQRVLGRISALSSGPPGSTQPLHHILPLHFLLPFPSSRSQAGKSLTTLWLGREEAWTGYSWLSWGLVRVFIPESVLLCSPIFRLVLQTFLRAQT